MNCAQLLHISHPVDPQHLQQSTRHHIFWTALITALLTALFNVEYNVEYNIPEALSFGVESVD